MKAEERHHLHENDLQRLAETARMRSQPFVARYGTAILVGAAVVIFLVALLVWWYRSQGTSDTVAWSELSDTLQKSNVTAEDFANIADTEDYADTSAAKWARLLEAETRLESGLEQLFTNRKAALIELESAKSSFDELADGVAVSPEHAARVHFGRAKALEATSDGDLQPAINEYEAVVSDFPDTVYATVAEERVAELNKPESKSFYAWFSKQTPQVKDPITRPNDGGLPSDPFAGSGLIAPPEETPMGNSTEGSPPANVLDGESATAPVEETPATDEGSANPGSSDTESGGPAMTQPGEGAPSGEEPSASDDSAATESEQATAGEAEASADGDDAPTADAESAPAEEETEESPAPVSE